jgi:hypothetical protein
MYEQSWESAHACVVEYIRARLPSQAHRAGLARETRTCMGPLTEQQRLTVRRQSLVGRVMCEIYRTRKITLRQGYYERNRQFQNYIKPKLFKISTLTIHGFVEKLWKFYYSNLFSMCAPLVTRHISTRQSNYCLTLAAVVVIRCFRSSKVTGTGGTKTLSLTYPHRKKSHRVLDRDFVVANMWVTCCRLLRGQSSALGRCSILLENEVAMVKLPEFLYKTLHGECRYLK